MGLFLVSTTALQAQSEKKTVLIIVDGIPPDVVENVPTPNLDEIAKVGGYSRAYVGGEKGSYSESPTISAVGYNSMLTGTWVNKHQVYGNDIKQPNYHYWTIFRLLEEQHPEKKTAIFSTWLDNRTKLLGEGLEATGKLQLDYHFDGFEHDTVNFPHDKERTFIYKIDEHVTDEAARYIRDEAPDLSWVYLEYTDDIGHMYGDGPEMEKAVALADDQIGRIWRSIQYRQQQTDEEWLIMITTDHGRDEQSGKHHGGQTDRERGIWITTNAKDLNTYYKNHEPGIVCILPTVARFMSLDIPKSQLFEMDGIPLTGLVSIANARLSREGDDFSINWTALEKPGQVKIWVSSKDKFRQGGKDSYELIGEVEASRETYKLPKYALKSEDDYVKLVLEGEHNHLNLWLPMTSEEQKK
ncbi:MAG: alkaline phosphatase family protein [Cyclobacteriaceae bacterium]